MEYPVKKLLIIREGKEPEFFGEPRPRSSHISYLNDYIESSYDKEDTIQRFKLAGDPNQIASALNVIKNAVVCMNIIDEKTMKYANSTILYVPQNMSEELQDKLRDVSPFLDSFKEIIACISTVERNGYGRLELVDNPIDIDNDLSIEDKLDIIIKESTGKSKRK